MENPTEYQTACPNKGTCRILMLEEQGVPMDPMQEIRSGVRTITKFHHGNVPAIMHFYCCTGCKQPFTQMEADKVNKFLGKRAADIELELDDDFLAALDEM